MGQEADSNTNEMEELDRSGGYARYMSQIVKREHELGFALSSGAVAVDTVGTTVNLMAAMSYQYNINQYVGWYTELGFAYNPLVVRGNNVIPDYDKAFFLNQMAITLLTGTRVAPWKNWFYLGGGLGLRYFQSFIPKEPPELNQAIKELGLRQLSFDVQYYFEVGFSVPAKDVIFDIGYRWRDSMLGALGEIITPETDLFTRAGFGEVIIHFTFPLGERVYTFEEKVYQKELAKKQTELDNLKAQQQVELDDLKAQKNIYESIEANELILQVTSVLFDINSAELSMESQKNLDTLVPVLLKMNPHAILVRGHTAPSNAPSAAVLNLARDRALAVKNYLEDHGVRRIEIKPVGATMPRQNKPNGDDQRRVDIVIQR